MLLFVCSRVVGGRQGIANELLHGCYDIVGSNVLLVTHYNNNITISINITFKKG